MAQNLSDYKFEQIKNFNCRNIGRLSQYKKFKWDSTECWLAEQTDVYKINVHYGISYNGRQGTGNSSFYLCWPSWESKRDFRKYVENLLYTFDGETMQDFSNYRKSIGYKF